MHGFFAKSVLSGRRSVLVEGVGFVVLVCGEDRVGRRRIARFPGEVLGRRLQGEGTEQNARCLRVVRFRIADDAEVEVFGDRLTGGEREVRAHHPVDELAEELPPGRVDAVLRGVLVERGVSPHDRLDRRVALLVGEPHEREGPAHGAERALLAVAVPHGLREQIEDRLTRERVEPTDDATLMSREVPLVAWKRDLLARGRRPGRDHEHAHELLHRPDHPAYAHLVDAVLSEILFEPVLALEQGDDLLGDDHPIIC